jgi:protease-4
MAMSRTRKIVLIVGGIVLGLFLISIIGIAILISSFTGGGFSVENNSVLVLKVSGELPDFSAEDPTARIFGAEQPPSFTNLLMQLKKAKVDKRIGGVLLDIDFPDIGWGKADELRDAITEFKSSGKPIYAFMELGTNKDYYIAVACDKVFMPPSGDLYINGLAAEVMFYRGTLDKLGIEPEVIQIGKYKNAPDQYTRKEMSEAHREVVNALLDDIFGRFVQGIAAARNKTPEDVKAIIDNAPYNAKQAKEQGLLDGALYRDEVYNEFKTKLGYAENEKLRLTGGSEYKQVTPDSLGLNQGEKIAVIFASGGISTGKSSDGTFGGSQTVGSDTVVRAVNDAAADESIKAIILRVDSPGGSALASDLIWHAVENAKTKKPVIVSMSDVAASGGYYIAANANKIVAEPSTVTGSIGVFLGKPIVKGMYNWMGITNEYVTRGKNAGIFRETEKWTPEERAKFEEQAKSIYYDNFVPKVAQGRGKNPEYVDSIGQGRVWTGLQAKERGLVDEFGGLEKATEMAKQLANIPEDKQVRRVVFPAPRPFLESIFNRDEDEATIKVQQQQKALLDVLPADARRALRFAQLFDQMKRGESMMLLPFELEIK